MLIKPQTALLILKFPVACLLGTDRVVVRQNAAELQSWTQEELPSGMECLSGMSVIDSLGFAYRLSRPTRMASFWGRLIERAASRLTVEFGSVESEGDADVVALQLRLVTHIRAVVRRNPEQSPALEKLQQRIQSATEAREVLSILAQSPSLLDSQLAPPSLAHDGLRGGLTGHTITNKMSDI